MVSDRPTAEVDYLDAAALVTVGVVAAGSAGVVAAAGELLVGVVLAVLLMGAALIWTEGVS